ncbi:MAG TPA: tetratricopeptide repeat protein [Planctomycetota bacterium]|nr:tetratricopeptide repeat protein [Planctomycetota bacterium]
MVNDSFRPLVTGIKLEFEGVEVSDVFPRELPNVLLGGQLIVTGRYAKAGTGRLVLSGTCENETYRREIDVAFPAQKNDNTFVPRLWARRSMDDMLYRIGRGDKSLAQNVIALSLKYKLMSPYTSFLVLETERDYEQFGIDRRFAMEQWTGGEKDAPATRDRAIKEIVESKAEAVEELVFDEADFKKKGDALFRLGAANREVAAKSAIYMPMNYSGPVVNRLVAPRDSFEMLADMALPSRSPLRERSSYIDNPGSSIYPSVYIGQETPEPPPPVIDPDVRAVIELFARGPVDFQMRMATKHLDERGATRSTSETTAVVIGKQWRHENVYDNIRQRSTRTCDGKTVYNWNEQLNYANAKEASLREQSTMYGGLPGMSGNTPEGIVRQGSAVIQSREGDIVVLAIESGNSRSLHTVDTAKKALLKIERFYRNDPGAEFKSSGTSVFEDFKEIGGRMLPMRTLQYSTEVKLTGESVVELLEAGVVKGEFAFTPPADALVAFYPLPPSAEARKAAADDDPASMFRLAFSLEMDRRFADAAKAVEKVIAARPDDPYPLLYRAMLLAAGGDKTALSDAARQAVEIVEKTKQDKMYLYRIIQGAMSRINMQDEMLPYIEFLLENTPKINENERVNLTDQLVRAYVKAGNLQKALDLWKAALAEMPDNGYAWMQAGQFYRSRNGMEDEAIAAYLKARELKGNVGDQIALLYQKRGEHDKAIAEWKLYLDKQFQSWSFRQFLSSVAGGLGWEAAIKEAETLIAAQTDDSRRKQAMLGYLQFFQNSEGGGRDSTDICRRLHEAYPDDPEVLQQVFSAFSNGTSKWDPMPAIEKLFTTPAKDAADASKRVQLLANLSNHGANRDKVLNLLGDLATPPFEMTPQEEANYLANVARLQRNANSDEAFKTYERIIALKLPEGDHRQSEARSQVFSMHLGKNDLDKAVDIFIEAAKAAKDDGYLRSMFRQLTDRLTRDKDTPRLLTLYSGLLRAVPQRELFYRMQIAMLHGEQGKTQEACDELWAVMQLSDAARLTEPEKEEPKKPADAAPAAPVQDHLYYLQEAGTALIRHAAADENLKAKFDAAIAARAKDEKSGEEMPWNVLLADLLAARANHAELTVVLARLAKQEKPAGYWTRRHASALAATRKYAEAEALYEAILRETPDDVHALEQLSKLAAAMKQPEKEKRYWDAYVKTLPEDENYVSQLSRELARNGQTMKAASLLERLISFSRYPFNYTSELSQMYQQLGRKFDAAMVSVNAVLAKGRQDRPFDRFNQLSPAGIWKLITEEEVFNKYITAVEDALRTVGDDPPRQAALMALLSDANYRRDDKPKAAEWAAKVMALAAAMDENSYDTLHGLLRQAQPPGSLAPMLEKTVAAADAGDKKAPDWLRIRLARELFAAGRADDGEKLFKQALETVTASNRSAKLIEMGDLFASAPDGKADAARAIALFDEAQQNATPQTLARALRRKAEVMAASKQFPDKEVLDAFRKAIAAADVNSRRAAIDAMAKYAVDAKLHDVVIEAYIELCKNSRDSSVRDTMRRLCEYMRQQKLEDRAEAVLRECIQYARVGYESEAAWNQFGRFYADGGDPVKAIDIWIEGLSAPASDENSSRRSNIWSNILRTASREMDKGKIDKEKVKKLLLDETDLYLAKGQREGSYWPGSFWDAAQRMGTIDLMVAKFEAVPDGQKEFFDVYRLIGQAYQMHPLNKPDLAIKYYKMALETGTLEKNREVLSQLVSIYRNSKEWQNALDCMEQNKENSWNWHSQRGLFLAKLARNDDALKAYEEAAAILGQNPEQYSGRREMCSSAVEAGLYDFAIKELTLALRLHDAVRRDPNNRDRYHVRECYRLLARCYREKGELDKAIEQLLLAQAAEPAERYQIQEELRALFGDPAKLDEYIAQCEKQAAETGLERPSLRVIFGDIFLRQNKIDEAIRHFNIALELEPNRTDVRERLIDALRRQNRTTEVLQQFRELVKYDPKRLQSYREMGRLLKNAGRESDSMRAYTTMLEALPTEADSHREMAGVYTEMKLHADAAKMWQKVVKFRPEEPQSYYGLAETYIRNERPEQAVEVYRGMLAKTWDGRFGNVAKEVEGRLEKLKLDQ